MRTPASPSPASSDLVRLRVLAREHRNAGRLQEAELTCRRALAINVADAELHRLLGTILHAQDRGAAAVASLGEAVRLDPRNTKASTQLAIALAEQGQLSEATTAAHKAIELSPRDVGPRALLARLKTFSPGDPDLLALEAMARDEGSFEDGELIALFFTLAKAYEDVRDYERSFAYLRRANALKRQTFEYDVDVDVRFLSQIAAVFQDGLLDQFAGAGTPSELPILIVGMPRSGTTLVEQILASHPAVHGGGELSHLRELAGAVALLNEDGRGFPDGVPQLRSEDLRRLGHGYVERLRQLAPGAARVTDKNNWNFGHLGLARLIVPEARVIVCTRNPIDTCFSCYSLQGPIEFACDLGELGRYYRGYARLMDHWRSVLPGEWMLEVSYEALVADFDREVRRIVTHCGLEWDDACLSFHATERPVGTASFAQVRRPIYHSSVARWRRYEPYLGPLLAALGLDGEGAESAIE